MSAENVKQAYVIFNNQKFIASYSEDTDIWTADIIAPSESSWFQPDHVYLAEIHAEDLAGNVSTITSLDEIYGDQLKIRVLEKTKPSIVINKPTQDAVLGDSNQDIEITLSDSGGSGINISSIVFKINENIITDYKTINEDPYTKIVYTVNNLSDGINIITFTVSDNDGNDKTESVSFIISTSAPSLEVITPTEELITNASPIRVSGVASTVSEYISISKVTINENIVMVDEHGNFEYDFALVDGENVIVVVAEDSIGKTTSITRRVILDTNAPVITDIHVEPLIVDASGTIRITFRVSDP